METEENPCEQRGEIIIHEVIDQTIVNWDGPIWKHIKDNGQSMDMVVMGSSWRQAVCIWFHDRSAFWRLI